MDPLKLGGAALAEAALAPLSVVLGFDPDQGVSISEDSTRSLATTPTQSPIRGQVARVRPGVSIPYKSGLVPHILAGFVLIIALVSIPYKSGLVPHKFTLVAELASGFNTVQIRPSSAPQ